MIPYCLFFVLLFTIDQIACFQCNKGENYAIRSTRCLGTTSTCSTITSVDKDNSATIMRDCDHDGVCSRFSIGNDQCKTDPSGFKICCCNSDLCNKRPAPPSPNNCWSGTTYNKTSVPCSNGFCTKIDYPTGQHMYECDATGSSPGSCLVLGNTCSPSRRDGMTVCCCSTDLCNYSPRSVTIGMALLLPCLAAIVFSQ